MPTASTKPWPLRRLRCRGHNPVRVLGIDLGDARIGVAISDDGGVLATPYETLQRSGDRISDHRAIEAIVEETGAGAVVVGMPYSLDGSVGHKAKLTRREIIRMGRTLSVPIHTQDERFTTVTAEHSMRAAGVPGAKKRQIVDQLAASVLLQAWLDGQKSRPPPQDRAPGHGSDH